MRRHHRRTNRQPLGPHAIHPRDAECQSCGGGEERGSGAIYEAARILAAIQAELGNEKYLTINPSVIVGGTKAALDDENDLMPICADIPFGAVGAPHSHGQNVLFAGGNVRFATVPTVGVNGDDIYRNMLGRVAAGVDRADAVLGVGFDRP